MAQTSQYLLGGLTIAAIYTAVFIPILIGFIALRHRTGWPKEPLFLAAIWPGLAGVFLFAGAFLWVGWPLALVGAVVWVAWRVLVSQGIMDDD